MATSPETAASPALGSPSKYIDSSIKIIIEATAEIIKPVINGVRGFCLSLLALTKKVPKMDVQIAPERARSGKTTPFKPNNDPPKIMAATMVTA